MTRDMKLTIGIVSTGLVSMLGDHMIHKNNIKVHRSHWEVYNIHTLEKIREIRNEETADMLVFNKLRKAANALHIVSVGATIADAVTGHEYDESDIHIDTLLMGAGCILGVGVNITQYTRQCKRLKKANAVIEEDRKLRERPENWAVSTADEPEIIDPTSESEME